MDASAADLDELAGAILDGTSVDWETVKSTANEAERRLIEDLRVVATLADFHRQQRADDDSVRSPQTWGHIRVLEPLGSGAFGRVYRAWDSRLDREVALKLLAARSDAGEARASSIIQEGRLLARVRHPNVMTIYGADRIGDTVGLWMELIDGHTVEQRLAAGPPFQPSQVIEIGIQICRAVSAVHRSGLLHRDIKAQNVMLATDGRAVLMDFGTGWEMSDASVSPGALAGTPLYLAPELFRGGRATVQSDVYSLGVLLYRMVSGTYPVSARSLPDLRLAHECRDGTKGSPLPPGVPRRLGRMIERAIDPCPEQRYESAEALATALSRLRRRGSAIPLKYAVVAAGAVVLAGLLVAQETLRRDAGPRASEGLVASTATKGFDRTAIAVLPLKNLSTEQGSEKFADGLTEEIINRLAANGHLQVRSRTSSFAFKNARRDLGDIAKQLDVSLVLDGSVRRSGNRLEVDARLWQASTGATLWDDSFAGDIADVMAIRDNIARSVVERLGLQATARPRTYDVNSEAYGLYLTGRALMSRRLLGPGGQKAVEYLQQVIAIDPAFAPAYAALAEAYAYMSLPTYESMPVTEAQPLMRAAALKALELDPDSAEAHAAMGIVDARDLDWRSSQREFEQAIALNPSLSQVYTDYSVFTLRPLRKYDEDERLLKVALKNDPLSLDVWREIGLLYFTVGRYDEAIDLLQRVRAVDPQITAADMTLARALACRGRVDEALALYDVMATQGPAGAPRVRHVPQGVPQYQAYAFVKAGRRSDAERLAAENDQYPYRATLIYAALGDADRAFEALKRTADREPQRVPLLLTWPEMAPLRADPRFAAMSRRFGLP